MEWDRFIREIGMIQKASHNYYFKPTDKTRSEPKTGTRTFDRPSLTVQIVQGGPFSSGQRDI